MIEKLIPRYLNKDDDARLIKSIEMTDALNVRVSSEENGDGGVVKNAFGNSAVVFRSGNNWQGLPHALPAPTNKVVGSVSDLKNGVIIYFLYNSNGDHSIYRFTTSQNNVELVYRDSVLAFQSDSFVKGDVINNLYNEVLLYFTDGITPPKKINVTRAIIGGYSEVITNGTDEQKLEFITLAKKPPLDPPTYEFFTDTTVDDNNIYEDNFQFAYQYVYLDGEYSALSKYTDLAVAQNQYLDGFIEEDQKNEYNAIRISVESSIADVKTIKVLGRRGNTGPWFIAGEISNPALASPATLYIEFRNDKLYRFISQDDANKIYDAVPLTAQSQTISGSRLFLGNYTEGYPNLRIDSAIIPNYEKEAQVINIPVETIGQTVTPNFMGPVKEIRADISSIPAGGVTADSILIIDFSIDLGRVELYAPGYFFNFVSLNENLLKVYGGALIESFVYTSAFPVSIYKKQFVPAGTSYNDIIVLIQAEIEDRYAILFGTDTTNLGLASRFSAAVVPNNAGRQDQKFFNNYGFFTGSGTLEIDSTGVSGNYANFVLSIRDTTMSMQFLCGAVSSNPNIQDSINIFETDNVVYNGDDNQYTKYLGILDIISTTVVQPEPNSTTGVFSSNSKFSSVLTSSSFLSSFIEGVKQFKSGASHELGIVFYDDRGRSSGVQTLSSPYVEWYSDRQYKGAVSIVMRIKSQGPSWARKWAPVYAKRGSIDRFIQYSVIDGFIASNPDADISTIYSNQNSIYLSMRSLEGKDSSYINGKDANLSYEYTDGDKLRVVSYIDDSTITLTISSVVGNIEVGDVLLGFGLQGFFFFTITSINLVGGVGTIQGTSTLPIGSMPSASAIFNPDPTNSVQVNYTAISESEQKIYPSISYFNVLGYSNFTDDPDTNPVLNRSNDDTIFNSTGQFLVLENNDGAIGFNAQSIAQGTSVWGNRCIVEIYRTRKEQSEEVYYEIGESYNVTNGFLSSDRNIVSQIAALCTNERPLQFRTNIILYAGDIISDVSGNSALVTNVFESVSAPYNYFVDCTLSTGSFTSTQTYTFNLLNSSDAVIQLTQGDTYFRIRQLRYGSQAKSFNYFVDYVESDTVSDFYESKNTSIGRPFAVLPDAKTIYRTGSVTYSDPFIVDVTRLGLSSFNPSLAPFYDLNYIHGSIRYMVNRDDSIVFLQDKKCGLLPVGRNLIEYVSGQQGVTVSTNVVGTPSYYVGDFGVGNNPESVAVEGGRVYFADIRNGKVMRISQDGLTAISETKMDSFFKGNFRDIVQFASVKRVVGGVDDEAGEYIIASDSICTSTIAITADGVDITAAFEQRCIGDGGTFEGTICFDAAIEVLLGSFSFTLQTNCAGSVVFAEIEYNDDKLPQFNTEVREFQDICDTFDNSVNAVVFLDRLTAGQAIIVGEEFQGTNSTIYGIATNSTYDFFVGISIDLSAGTFTFINTCGNYNGAISNVGTTDTGFTVAYDTEDKVWNTRYSYSPERIATLDDTLYTFKAGTMYVHDDTSNRSTYYGVAGGTIVEVISNNNPSMVKSYESLSLEGTDAWATVITNTDQSTSILTTDFSEREREFFAYVPRDTSANVGTSTITSLSGSSEVFVLGNVATSGVSGSTITFTTPVGDVPFPFGGTLYKVSGSTLVTLGVTVTAISANKQITASGAIAGVSDGNTIVVLANAGVEGDQLRDYYARINLTNTDTSEIELYAVNAVFAQSNLHNQQGQ
jgi:hypothetical protein